MAKAKKVGTAIVAATGPLTPMGLLELATKQGADVTKLTELMTLQERWERNEAKKAFVAAMTVFKKDPPTIRKNKGANFEGRSGGARTSYRYATLDNVCDQIVAALSRVGI